MDVYSLTARATVAPKKIIPLNVAYQKVDFIVNFQRGRRSENGMTGTEVGAVRVRDNFEKTVTQT